MTIKMDIKISGWWGVVSAFVIGFGSLLGTIESLEHTILPTWAVVIIILFYVFCISVFVKFVQGVLIK